MFEREQNFENSDFEIEIERRKALEILRKLRYDYIEEFPPDLLKPEMPNYHLYKCRTNFFHVIALKIFVLEQKGLIKSNKAKDACNEFLAFCETLQGRTEFYKQEDIDKANKVLDLLIEEIS